MRVVVDAFVKKTDHVCLDERAARNRGVSNPRTRAGLDSSRKSGVAHATVPLLSQSEPLSEAAKNAASALRVRIVQLLAAPWVLCTSDEPVPIARQLVSDGDRVGRRGLRLCNGSVPLLDPLGRRMSYGGQGGEMAIRAR